MPQIRVSFVRNSNIYTRDGTKLIKGGTVGGGGYWARPEEVRGWGLRGA